MSKLRIVADTHNVPALEKILTKLENIISLGDIAAVDTQEYFNNTERYSKAWKGYKKNELSDIDYKWFEKLNGDGWHTQVNNISKNAKYFSVVMGNSDEYMVEYIPDAKVQLDLAQKQNDTFKFYNEISLLNIDNVQLLFLPFRKTSFLEDLTSVLQTLKQDKMLFVFGHCPPYSNHRKEYYLMHHEALEFIQQKYDNIFYYFHGHIHSDKTYMYTLKSLPNIKLVTPKAPDTIHGINWDHDYIELDTNNGDLNVFSLESNKEVGFADLPKGYREKPDHWNDFVLP